MVALVWPIAGLAASDNPLAGMNFYVDPNSQAVQQIEDWGTQYPKKQKLLKKISKQPVAQWFGDWNSDITQDVKALMAKAKTEDQVPVLVVYNIPQRDCGSYSSGGAADAAAYKLFVRQLAKGIGTAQAVVILEPDALGVLDCLSASDKTSRFDLLTYAVKKIKHQPQTILYIDAGHPDWVAARVMAKRLKKSGITQADGFALNVSNFYSTKSNLRYGKKLSAKIADAHFVIDTSRNGQGISTPYQWCNPPDMGLGFTPTTNTGHDLVDAWLWIKPPGESDGECNGGPSAGTWWLDYALDLARNAT